MPSHTRLISPQRIEALRLQQVAGDDDALDLVGAFIDLHRIFRDPLAMSVNINGLNC